MTSDPPDDRTQRTRPPDLSDTTEPGRPPRRPTSSSPNETHPISPSSSGSPSRASVPPSEPRSASRASFSQIDLSTDRPARLQMIVALLLGLVLVAIPLYLWRRPRAESIAAAGLADAAVDPAANAAPPSPAASDESKPSIGEAKTLSCHDAGPKKTAPEQCDHLAEVEKAFARAIEESASCVPKDAGGGTIQYVADVSFKRRAVSIATPKDGRTMKNGKVVGACQAAVKGRLASLPLDTIQHAHARYKVAITASYAGAVK